MLEINGYKLRNLQEQVEKNKNDIIAIINEQGTLNQFGLKVVEQYDTLNDLPTVDEYKQENPDADYGDTIAIGTTAPYSLYILTRASGTHPNDYWFEIGEFPMPGPKGEGGKSSTIKIGSTTTTVPGSLAKVVNVGDETTAQLEFYIPAGKKGDQGITPTVNIGTVTAGDYANVTNSGSTTDVVLDFVVPRGPKGDSIKGDPGDSFKIIGTLDNTNQLPTPTEAIRSNAYLIADNTGRKHLWVITGDATLLWTDAGAITGIQGQAASITVGGTVTLPAGQQASVVNEGTTSDAVLNFSVPRGADGEAATIEIGSVSTLPSGNKATVTNIGTSQNAILNFGIPKGEVGPAGVTAEAIELTPASATQGTLTDEQLTKLQSNVLNYILLNNEIYYCNDPQTGKGYLVYSHEGQDNTHTFMLKAITITLSTKGWILYTFTPQSKLTFDTTPTANSNNPVTSAGILNSLNGKLANPIFNLKKNGYIRLTNGLTLQWGEVRSSNTREHKVTFPLAYSTLYTVVATYYNYSNDNTKEWNIRYENNTGFSIKCNSSEGAESGCNWMAIGMK